MIENVQAVWIIAHGSGEATGEYVDLCDEMAGWN